MSSELPVPALGELSIHSPQRVHGAQTPRAESPEDAAAAGPSDLAKQKVQATPSEEAPERLNANHREDGRRKGEEKEEEEEASSLARCYTNWWRWFAWRSFSFNPSRGSSPREPSGPAPEHAATVAKKCRKREMAGKQEDEAEKQPPQKKSVSKALMDTLWAKFKAQQFVTIRESYALAFEFSLTEEQIDQWFREKRKKYNKEICKWKYKKRYIKKKKGRLFYP